MKVKNWQPTYKIMLDRSRDREYLESILYSWRLKLLKLAPKNFGINLSFKTSFSDGDKIFQTTMIKVKN